DAPADRAALQREGGVGRGDEREDGEAAQRQVRAKEPEHVEREADRRHRRQGEEERRDAGHAGRAFRAQARGEDESDEREQRDNEREGVQRDEDRGAAPGGETLSDGGAQVRAPEEERAERGDEEH